MGKPDSQTSVSNRVNAIQTANESLGVDSDKLNARSTTVSAIDTALSQIQALSDQIQAMRLEIDQSLNELSKEATDILRTVCVILICFKMPFKTVRTILITETRYSTVPLNPRSFLSFTIKLSFFSLCFE